MKGLLNYTVTHFEIEETLHENAGYPFLKGWTSPLSCEPAQRLAGRLANMICRPKSRLPHSISLADSVLPLAL